MKNDITHYVLIGVLVFAGAGLLFSVVSLFGWTGTGTEIPAQTPSSGVSHFSAKFTTYDVALSTEFMDKDGDGKCDLCGMDIGMCMSGSGQLECSMDPDATIGPLDTTKEKHHYHADFAVFLDGKQVDFNNEKYFVKSAFMHVENDDPEEAGKVLHMHAEGVPLWLFFESVGIEFTDKCFILDTGEEYCNDNENTLKMYLNGEENSEYQNYVFQDHDKILISYGDKNKDVSGQLATVTDFATED